MDTSTQSPTLDESDRDPRLDALARVIEKEAEALKDVLPAALARQWSASPVPRPREDTPQRASGERPSDPTADTVLDPRRLAVRGTVIRAERVLLDAAAALRAARLAVVRAVETFDGEEA